MVNCNVFLLYKKGTSLSRYSDIKDRSVNLVLKLSFGRSRIEITDLLQIHVLKLFFYTEFLQILQILDDKSCLNLL